MEPFQRIRPRRAGDAGVSPPRVDESTAASLPTAPDEKAVKGKVPLVEERTHQRPRNPKQQASRRHSLVALCWSLLMLDTAHAADTSDNGRSARHRAPATSHCALVAALGDREDSLLDSGASYQAGERTLRRQILSCRMDVPTAAVHRGRKGLQRVESANQAQPSQIHPPIREQTPSCA